MRDWLITPLSPFASGVAVGALAVAAWILILVPLWRAYRSRLWSLATEAAALATSILRPLRQKLAAPKNRWLTGAVILLIIFSIGVWAGQTRKIFRHSEDDVNATRAEDFEKYSRALREQALSEIGPPGFAPRLHATTSSDSRITVPLV